MRGQKGSTAVLRMGTVVVAMELAAVLVAYVYFGWPVLLIGAPALQRWLAVGS
jgi:hypothetical protein